MYILYFAKRRTHMEKCASNLKQGEICTWIWWKSEWIAKWMEIVDQKRNTEKRIIRLPESEKSDRYPNLYHRYAQLSSSLDRNKIQLNWVSIYLAYSHSEIDWERSENLDALLHVCLQRTRSELNHEIELFSFLYSRRLHRCGRCDAWWIFFCHGFLLDDPLRIQ